MSVIHNPHFHQLKCWWWEFNHLLSNEEYGETKQIVLGSPTGRDIERLDAIACQHSPMFANKREKRKEATSVANKSINTYQVEPIKPENIKVLLNEDQSKMDFLELENKRFKDQNRILENKIKILEVELSATYQRVEQYRRMIDRV
jgi:hypothetical protein